MTARHLGLAIVLLTNLAGITMSVPLAPNAPASSDLAQYTGRYERGRDK